MKRKNKVSKKFAFKLLLIELKLKQFKHKYKCIIGGSNFTRSKNKKAGEYLDIAFRLFEIVENLNPNKK